MWPPILSVLVWLTAFMCVLMILRMILQCMRAVYGNDRQGWLCSRDRVYCHVTLTLHALIDLN